MSAELCKALGIQKLVGSKSLHARRLCFGGLFRKVVFLRHLFTDRGKLTGHVVLEFLQLGPRFRRLARLCGIALFHLGLALRNDRSHGFSLRVDEQILQILI